MTEKYKIYISGETRSRLENDAEFFEFIKKDTSVNLNAFLKTLLVNYFDRYRRESDELRSSIMQDLSGIPALAEQEAARLADRIVRTYIKNEPAVKGRSTAITLTVSGASFEIIRIIENNLLRDISLSQYLRDLFYSYLSIPRNEREAIIFRDTYEDIHKALQAHRVLSFTTAAAENNTVFSAEPYLIAPSKEEQCNYLICVDRAGRVARTFRISRLRSVFVTSDTFSVDPELQQELLEKSTRSPHSVSPVIHATVHLNKYGKKKYRSITKNRPPVSKIEGDTYYFDWPAVQLIEYFKRFGRDAVVLSPASLKEALRKHYYYALREYSK